MKDGRDERKGKKWGEVCVERREKREDRGGASV